MLKNVTFLQWENDGRVSYRLLGPDGTPIPPFEAFANFLARKSKRNTRRTYCFQLAHFFDYLYEATALLSWDRGPPTRLDLEEVIEAYDDYLVMGGDSGNSIARLVNKSMPSPQNSSKSSALAHSAIRQFLKLSERVRLETLELVSANLRYGRIDPSPVILGVGLKAKLEGLERQAIVRNSMVGAVLAGGPKLIERAVLRTPPVQVTYKPSRAFPFNSIADFIWALPSHRDRALYSLLAASGGRTHECLQILFDDVQAKQESVDFVDPASRRSHPSYLYLSLPERELLSWKGRNTQATFLIEPFASMFFDALEQYLRHEYIPHGLHRFVFQYSATPYTGRPYFLSSPSSRLQTFKTAAKKAGIEHAVCVPHSLRHAYGTYLVNYFPRSNGEFGLPLGG